MVAACPFPANYGTPGAIREMSETLAEMGHKVHVVTYPFGDDIPVNAAQVHRVAPLRKKHVIKVGPSLDKIFLNLRLIRLLFRVVVRERVHVIHGHNFEGGLIGLICKWLTGRPLLYNGVNSMIDELPGYSFIRPLFLANWIAKFLDRFMPANADHIIAVSPELKASIVKEGVSPEKVDVVPCGVIPEMFDDPHPEKFLQKYGIGDQPIVLYTGVLNAFQRIDYLLRAFALASEEEPAALLVVASPLEHDPHLKSHKALAAELNISEKIVWISPHTLEDVPSLIAMATVTVVSRPEMPGHPIKLLNYMVSGKPTVCFAGAAKGVAHLHSAFVVPDHDFRQLGHGIVTLLRDPELAGRLGANARKTALETFDWRVICRNVEFIYDRLTGHDHRARPKKLRKREVASSTAL